MMVVVGIDVHKATHTAVAVNDVGRQLGCKTVPATDEGHRQLLAWALHHWGKAELRFAVEDCRAVSTRLERALLGAGQGVVRVPPHLMADHVNRCVPGENPIPSTPSRSAASPCVNRICPPRHMTGSHAISSSW